VSRRTSVGLLLATLVAAGCATTGSDKPHVLSGEAPVEEVIAKADESYRAGDFKAATILYQIAIGQEATADAWFKLGMAENYQGNRDKSLFSFVKALDLDPEHPGALEKLGLYYTSRGDVDRARNYLDRLLAVDESNWRGHNSLGVLADLEKEFPAARDHYLAALKLQPGIPMLWNNLGYSVYLMGDLERATTYMKRALELDPGYAPARQNLALVFVRKDEYDEALVVLLEKQDVPTAYTNVGYLAYMVGDYDRAEQYLEEAIRQSPTFNKQAHTYLAATRKASKNS
jgi:Flp pilus assembly protein TadD